MRGPVSATVGRQIRVLRLSLGYSQQEVGRRAGITQCKISRFEKGQSSVTVDEATQLALAFGVNVRDLLDSGVEFAVTQMVYVAERAVSDVNAD